MIIKNVLIGLTMMMLCACTTTGNITSEQVRQGTEVTDNHTVVTPADNSTARRIVAFPLKAVGLAAAGIGLLMMELADSDYSSDGQQDHGKGRDAGLTLSGLGLALGGALMYELGESISE